MKTMLSVLLTTSWLAGSAAYARANEDLPVVSYVDLERYMGRWYEIASLPQWFQRGCFATEANYTLREDGKVDVLNRCHKGSLTGELTEANGVGRVVDTETNAKLAVSFFWPFEGDYWIIALADDYSYAMVGGPDRSSLWILSRTPSLDEATLATLLAQAKGQGFDTSKLGYTVHRETPQPHH